jgi:hypothetical protein
MAAEADRFFARLPSNANRDKPEFQPESTARQSVAAVDEIERPARLRACDKPPRKRKILDMEKVQALTENLSFMVSFDAEWLTRMQVAQPLTKSPADFVLG